MSYTEVFGGSTIFPADVSYLALALTGDIDFEWPVESAAPPYPLARIIDVIANGPHTMRLPDATIAAPGETALFNVLTASSSECFVVDHLGVAVGVMQPGEQWEIYLTDNTTVGGQWEIFHFGASTATVQPSALAGYGITVTGSTLSQSVPVTTFNATPYTAGPTDRASALVWTGSGSGAINLPGVSAVGNNFFVSARNAGGGMLTLDPNGGEEIDGGATVTLSPGEGVVIVTDGLVWYTLGRGQAAVFAFDYTSIDVSPGGTYTLTGSELNRIAYRFTGVLTADVTVIVPSTVQQYWVDNATTGSFGLSLSTLAGVPVAVAQGARGIYYSNGINVVDADTGGISTPVNASDGGTGHNSYAIGDLLTASSPATLARLAAVPVGAALISQGAGVMPLWGDIDLTNSVTGVLPPANGGTGTLAAFTLNFHLKGGPAGQIMSSPVLMDDGAKVGIGTATPSARLTINNTYGTVGDTFAALRLNTNNSASGLYLAGYNLEANVAHNAEFIAGSNWVARDVAASIHTLLQGYHLFYGDAGLTVGAAYTPKERMRIGPDGNVGINNNSPSAKLHVTGTVFADSFRVQNAAPVVGAGMWGLDTTLAFNTNSNEHMRITTDGNIGIGTTGPGAKVDIVQGAPGVAALRAVGNASANPGNVVLLGIVGVTNGYVLAKDAVNNVWHSWSVTGGEAMRVHSNGFLGVGTNAPTRLIHARAAGANAIISAQCTAGSGVEVIMQSNDTVDGRIGTASGHPLYLITGGTPQFNISTSGDVRSFCNEAVFGRGTTGLVGLTTGTTGNTGYLALVNASSVRVGYVGFAAFGAGGSITYANEQGGFHAFNTTINPTADGNANCGQASLRWGTVFAQNGAISTSDEREKDWLGAPDEAAIRAAGRIIDELGFFTWKDGPDTAVHYGVRAQQVLRIFMEEGLEDTQDIDFAPDTFISAPPTLRHALVQFDTWEATETSAPPPPPTEDVPEPRAPDPIINPAGNRFSMNLAELGLFVATAQHARMNALEARLTAAGI